MKKDITIITAFFDINRESITGFNRSNQKYIDAFRFWASIQNDLVVYSDEATIEEVKKIRESYGLLEKTKTIVIDDYLDIDRELYDSIDGVMKSSYFLDFHLQTAVPEAVSPKYNYIMALKAWCVNDAYSRGAAKGMLCWLDFGFNYGGTFYRKSEEFNFLWKYNFSEKIHLLQVNELDDLPPFEIIRRNNSYIQGGEIIAPDYMWKKLWNSVRSNMLALNKSGLADDDQILLLMAYKDNPSDFEMHNVEWLGLFKEFGGKHFTFEKPSVNNIWSFLYKCKHPNEFILVRYLTYSVRTFKSLLSRKFRG